MKKNFIPVAKMFLLGTVAITSASLASCSDDIADQSTANNYLEVTANGDLDGTFMGSAQDKQLTMVVNGNDMTLSSSSGGSATTKVTNDNKGESFKGEFSSPFMNIKSFEFKKFGTFYYGLIAQMTDGTQQEFGFRKGVLSRAGDSSADKDFNTDYFKGVMKSGLEALLDLNPVVKIAAKPLADLFLEETPAPDMSVDECYKKLDESLSKISLQISDFESKYSEATGMEWLKSHNLRRSRLEVPTRNILSKILSLKEANSPEAEAQIKEEVKKWGASYADDARVFIDDVNDGTPLYKPYSSVVDSYAETLFPWEHQGYDIREKYRLHELNLVAELATMMILNFNEDYSHNDPALASKLEHIAKVYKDNEVVKDNEHAICQIEGANHIKINKTKIGEDLTEKPASQTNTYSMFAFPKGKNEITDDLGYMVVPTYNKSKNCVNEEEYQKAKAEMMSVSEAEAIMKYYGNTRSMHDILAKEAGLEERRLSVNSNPYSTWKNQENFIFLSGASSYTANKKYDQSLSTACSSGVIDVYINKVCYLDRTSKGIDSYYVGTAEFEWFQGWDKARFLQKWKKIPMKAAVSLNVEGRDNGWKPGHYLDKK